jgi:hypothetical protein
LTSLPFIQTFAVSLNAIWLTPYDADSIGSPAGDSSDYETSGTGDAGALMPLS